MPKVGIKRELLDLLENLDDFVTAKKLAEDLSVSSKTIYRTIDQINQKVGNPPLILTAKGKEIRINKSRESNTQIHHEAELPNGELSPRKRREQITLRLLYLSPRKMKLRFLLEQYFVSESVINNDERMINDWLQEFNLKLDRENRELGIVGEESQIRRAISALTDFTGIIDFSNIGNQGSVTLNERDVHFIAKLLRDAEKRLQIEIPYPYDINIFSHIYILINRYRNVGQKSYIDINDVQTRISLEEQLYRCAKWMVQKIRAYSNLDLPDAEIIYIYEYLESSRIKHLNAIKQDVPQEAVQISEEYAQKVAEKLNCPVNDKDILQDLINHIRPMLNRLSNGIYAKNELLDQIKQEYPKVFAVVSEVSQEISTQFKLPQIPEDENGFISIYFAREIERSTQPLKILVACTTGIGTAELLRVKIEKLFPELEIEDVVSIRGYENHKQQYDDVDLIVSTVPLSGDHDRPNVVVSALLGQKDQRAIRHEVNNIERRKHDRN